MKVPQLSEFKNQFFIIFAQQQHFTCPISGDSRASSLSSFSNDTGNNDEQLSVGGQSVHYFSIELMLASEILFFSVLINHDREEVTSATFVNRN